MSITFRNFQPSDLQNVQRIFFESSARQNFASSAERENFAKLWLSPYHASFAEFFWVAESKGACMGYLTGCPDSHALLSHFSQGVPSFALFQDLFAEFPAHLHINIDASARSSGIGSQLIQKFAEQVGKGVHIITDPKSRNREFYRRNGFLHEEERNLGEKKFLFMGR